MSDYNALVNLRFNRTSGPVDLIQNNWNSKSSTSSSTIDTVDYSAAGQFSGNCATFNGESSSINKVNGSYLLLDENSEFTISFWINTDLSESITRYMILSDGDSEGIGNKIFINNNEGNVYLSIFDRNGTEFKSNNISSSFNNNIWNYIAIIKFKDSNDTFKLCIFLNGILVSNYFEMESAINIDKIRATIGKGYDHVTRKTSYFKGHLDDIVILSNALTITDDEINIPTDYLISNEDEEDQNVWKDKEPEYSKYSEIMNLTEFKRKNNKTNIGLLQDGLTPYRVYPMWKQIMDNTYFKNGEYYVSFDKLSVKISIEGIFDNHFLVDSSKYKYLETTALQGFNDGIFNAAILFLNGKFIPWSKWTIVKSDRFITFIIKGLRYDYEITSLEMIVIPTATKYSEQGLIPYDGYKMFGFTSDGSANGDDIIIANINPNILMTKYLNLSGNDTKEVEIDIKEKLTSNNVLVFKAGTNDEAKDIEIITELGNYLTIKGEEVYDVYVIWNTLHMKSEDNASFIPNEQLMRRYLSMDYSNYDPNDISMPINLLNLHDEFNWIPTWNGKYQDKYYNSMYYMFNYNRNKYDKIYENIRPVNNIQMTGKDLLSLQTGDSVTIDVGRDVYDHLDIKNDTYIMIFVNGVLPSWYSTIEYINHTFIRFTPDNINDDDIVEICFFRDICNIIVEYNKKSKYLEYLDNYLYIPKEDLIVYTDRKGYLNLCPVLYTINDLTSRVELVDEKYSEYKLYFGSRRQFLYANIPIYREVNSLPLPYTFRTGYNVDNYLVFLNGKIMDSAYYRIVIPKLDDNRVKNKTLYFVNKITPDDKVEVFYISCTCNKMNTSGDLVIKAIKAPCTETNQRKFLIPLPYSNYPIDYDTFIVMNKSLKMGIDRYKISSETTTKTIKQWNDITGENEDIELTINLYYVEFLDQNDYLIPGEELTFLFPYYKAEWETVDEPTNENTLQFITRYAKITSEQNTVQFPSDYMGNVEDTRYIYIFIDTKLIDPSEYILSDVNTIIFNENVPVGSEVAMVIETDRYNFKENNVFLHFSNLVVGKYGQLTIDLPTQAVNKEYIFFKNNILLSSDGYTIHGNKLILDKNQSDLVPGEIITAVYATDGGSDTNNINFQTYVIKAIKKNVIDIPNFTNIKYTDSNVLVFINNEFCPNAYYKVSGNTITFIDNAYINVTDENEDTILFASNRGSDIVRVNDEVTVFIAYKSINPNTINYNLGNKEFIRFSERNVKATTDNQRTFEIQYPAILSMPFRDNKFILFLRGVFIPEIDYEISEDNLTITIINNHITIRKNDELTFLFCHIYDFTDINKYEYTTELSNGQHSLIIPSIYSSAINLNDRIMVFYGGTYIDPSRYSLDRLTRTIVFDDIPSESEYNRRITIVFLYTGLHNNGSIAMLPQSGYICFNEHYIDRNYNKEMYMLFINGKKVPKSYIYDITNSIKKIIVDIKSRYDLIALSTSPLITEFKQFYDDEEFIDTFDVSVVHPKNAVLEVTCGNNVYTSSFKAKYSEYFSVKYIPNRGYETGDIFVNDDNVTYGNVFKDLIISGTDAVQGIYRTIHINQKDNELIYVKCNGTTYKEEFSDIQGSTIEIYVECGRIGYTRGNITVDGTEVTYNSSKDCWTGVINEDDITIDITDTIVNSVPFRVLNDNMYAQKLTVEFYDTENNQIGSYTNLGTTISLDYGTRMKFVLKSTDPRYKRADYIGPFKVNTFYAVDYQYPLDNLIPESVSTVKRHYIDIKQSTNEILYVDTYPDPELIETTQTKERHIASFYGSSNDIFTISAEPNHGYTIGNIVSSNNKLYGPISETFSVTITPAILETVILEVSKNDIATGSITVRLNDGSLVGVGTYVLEKNTIVDVNVTVNGVTNTTSVKLKQDQRIILNYINELEFEPELEIE